MSYKIAILSSTNGTNLKSFIDAKLHGGLEDVEICCLITDKSMCGAAQKARDAKIKVYFIDPEPVNRETYDQSVVDTLAYFDVDLVVLGGYMKILGKSVTDRFKGKIVNVHPSLLPKFAGGMNLNVHQAVIDAGEKESGMTIHWVTEALDAGETAESLKQKVQALEIQYYPKVVDALLKKKSIDF